MQRISLLPIPLVVFNHLPRLHRIILGSLSIATLILVVWRPPIIYAPMVQTAVNTTTIPITDHSFPSLSLKSGEPYDVVDPLDQITLDNNYTEISQDDLEDQKGEEKMRVYEYVISSGDTLTTIFTQYGIDITTIMAIAHQFPALQNLKIGQILSFWILPTKEGNYLQRLTLEVSRHETRKYDRIQNGGFKESVMTISGEWRNMILSGQLNGSFIVSARKAGLTHSDINAVIQALQWQIDFHKLRQGDQFSVFTSWKMLNGKNIQSQLLGVRLCTGGKDYYAFRAEDGKFYKRDAAGLTPHSFIRSPTIKQFRVSSHFNPRRINPITGRIVPHRGVDFAMPVGTPVLAVGDGEVVISKNGGSAGNYIVIRHARQYMTRYMHLNQLLVKPGQRVKRGDRIALSGNTGRSTGPHLHFEVWINQQAVNPLTAQLPRTEELTGRERVEYLVQVKKILPYLQFK